MRYLTIADSIVLRLSQKRHFPSYIISNGYGRFMAFSNRLSTVQGAIAHVRREYNLRLSMQRRLHAEVDRIADALDRRQ